MRWIAGYSYCSSRKEEISHTSPKPGVMNTQTRTISLVTSTASTLAQPDWYMWWMPWKRKASMLSMTSRSAIQTSWQRRKWSLFGGACPARYTSTLVSTSYRICPQGMKHWLNGVVSGGGKRKSDCVTSTPIGNFETRLVRAREGLPLAPNHRKSSPEGSCPCFRSCCATWSFRWSACTCSAAAGIGCCMLPSASPFWCITAISATAWTICWYVWQRGLLSVRERRRTGPVRDCYTSLEPRLDVHVRVLKCWQWVLLSSFY